LFTELNIFIRNKKPFAAKVTSVLDYMFGISYRKIKQKLEFLYGIKICITSIYKWVKKFCKNIKVATGKKYREQIAVDETCIMDRGEKLYLWAAIDLNTKEIVAYHSSIYRNSIEAGFFLRKVLDKCTNKPIIISDRGPWYIPAFKRLHIDYWHDTFKIRNPVEQLFKLVKDRTRVFYNNVGSVDLVRGTMHIGLFMKMFCFYYTAIGGIMLK